MDPGEQRADATRRFVPAVPADEQRLDQRVLDRDVGVEAAQRVLEDVLDDASSAQLAPLSRRVTGDVHAVNHDAPRRRRNETQDGAGEGRLAGSRLTDQSDDLATVDLEGDAVEGLATPAAPAVVDLKAGHLQDGCVSAHRGICPVRTARARR